MNIIMQQILELKTNPKNTKIHSQRKIGRMCRAIKRFGFTTPVVVDSDNNILAGHCRASAALLIGMEEVPTVRLDHLSEEEARAYMIADNKLAEGGKWDMDLLASEMEELCVDSDLDSRSLGFTDAEFDGILKINIKNNDDTLNKMDEIKFQCEKGSAYEVKGHLLVCKMDRFTVEAVTEELLKSDEKMMVYVTSNVATKICRLMLREGHKVDEKKIGSSETLEPTT